MNVFVAGGTGIFMSDEPRPNRFPHFNARCWRLLASVATYSRIRLEKIMLTISASQPLDTNESSTSVPPLRGTKR